MTDRREFLKKSGWGALALAFSFNNNAATESEAKLRLSGKDSDWTHIRKQFLIDKHICYMNNGTLGPSPKSVINSVHEMTLKYNQQMSPPQYNSQSKEALARFMGVDKTEIALTHNVTEGINIAVFGVPLKAGDEVILTDEEHVGNALPWLNRSRRDGIKLKVISPAKTAQGVLDQIEKSITAKTRIIAIPHIPCTTGQVYPIREISKMARQKNIRTIVDGAHGTGLLDLNLKELGCDVYVSCCHKWLLGPNGTGYMYIRKELIPEFDAVFVGGHSDKGWVLTPEEQKIKGFKMHAHKYHYGTQNFAIFHGIAEAVKFHEKIGKKRIEERIRFLNNYLYESVRDLGKGFHLISPDEAISRCGILTFKLDTIGSKELVHLVRRDGFVIRYLPESGHEAVRVSTHIYNSTEEIDQLVQLLKKALKKEVK